MHWKNMILLELWIFSFIENVILIRTNVSLLLNGLNSSLYLFLVQCAKYAFDVEYLFHIHFVAISLAHTTILSKRKKWKRISQNRSERTSNIFFSCVIIVLKYFIYGWVFISFLLLSIYQCRQNVEKMRKKIFRVVSVE